MNYKTGRILFGLLACLFLGTTAAQAQANFTAAADGAWTTPATWTFTGVDADGIPDADDSVTIPNTRTVTVDGAQAAQNLNVNGGGTLTLNAGSTLTMSGTPSSTVTNNGTVNGTGSIRTQDTTTVNIGGTFTASLVVVSGTTTTGSSTIGGSINILNGATFQVSAGGFAPTHSGDLTIASGGTLNIGGGGSTFDANGANIVNNGTVSGSGGTFRFGGTAQNLSGTGSFINGGIVILGTSTTTLTSSMTFGNGNTTATNFVVNGGGTLAVGGNTLTLNGVGFTNNGTSTSAAGGKIRMQGMSSVAIGGTFTAALEINSGTTTTGSSTIGGSINILNGATFQVNAGGFQTVHSGDLTIATGGTLNIGSSSIFDANGANIVNNGTVSGANFRFGRNGAQTLSGTGAFTTPSVSILNGSTVTLGSNHQFNALTVNGGGTFSTATFTAFLNGAGTPLSNSGTAINGSFTYNGILAQTVQTNNVDYTQLGIDNAAGVTLPAAETVSQRVSLINGVFNNGAFLTIADGATIARDNGTLQTVPTFAGNFNVEYFGTNTITTGIELPASTTLLTNLTLNKTGGATVTLDKTPTVNGTATFTSGILLTGANTLNISATGTTAGASAASYVNGTVRKFNPGNGFVFPVGTANGYSPLILPTASGAGDLTVNAVQTIQPDVVASDQMRALKRYWTLTEGGSVSAVLQFNYLQADVPPEYFEQNLSLRRYETGTFTPIMSTINTVNNTSTTNAPITDFSDWTLVALGPTPAPADIGGRVIRADGSPLAGVRVSATGSVSQGIVKTTDADGTFIFPEMSTGETYVISVQRRGYRFDPANRVLSHTGTNTGLTFTGERDTSTQEATSGSDFDGDGLADLAVFRPENGTWYVKLSSDGTVNSQAFGADGDITTAGDFDGDGRSDYAVFRPSNNYWYLLRSSDNTFTAQQFGTKGDLTAQGDYDGDGKTDVAVYRPSEGIWYIWKSGTESLRAERFGAETDKIVPADYDGDGKTDIAVYRPTNGNWYILNSSDGGFRAEHFGAQTDIPASADFDGDGKTDISVFRPSEGTWHILRSSNGVYAGLQWGQAGDVTVPADYDGDGRADVAVFRNGFWYVLLSGGNGSFKADQFGQANDKPIPNTF